MTLALDEEAASSPQAIDVCSLENYLALPDHSMDDRIASARAKLGSTTILLGHHYQRDEVIRFADFTGDSYRWPLRRQSDNLSGLRVRAENLLFTVRRWSHPYAAPEVVEMPLVG